MAIKLQQLLRVPARGTEPQDVTAAFTRLAQTYWGASAPVEAERFARNTLTVTCPSPLWKTEVLFQEETLRHRLHEILPTLSLRRIRVVLR